MFSLVQSVIGTILIAFFLRFFVFQPFVVEGSSMEPNFHNNQYIIIDKFTYRFREPVRGEVIVFHPPTAPGQNYIKRIIGLPGETVQIQSGEVYVNGQKLDEPYLGNQNHKTDQLGLQQPITLGEDEYFVMGDNRAHSLDSREWGKLSINNFEGRTWFIAFPFNQFEFIKNPTYPNTIPQVSTGGSLQVKLAP